MSYILLAIAQPLQFHTLSQQLLRQHHQVKQLALQSSENLEGISADSELIVLNHPDFSVLKHSIEYLQEMAFRARILVITNQLSVAERVELWQLGVDDQLAQPIHLPECLLRCRRLLHYHKVLKTEALTSTSFSFQPHSGLLTKPAGYQTRLRRREADIFSCLLRHKNQVVSREMLIKWVWSGQEEIPTYSTIDVYLRRIRMALNDRGNMVKTIRGFGYMLCD